jgi:multidrug transporter EmrE-like cation transporter
VVGVAAVGILAEGERSSLIRVAFLAVILSGVIGLKLSDPS